MIFSGHVNNSFYVKSSFSPDDRYIVSGSSDYDVYIWDTAHPLLAPLRLKGHHGEVSDVAWNPSDPCMLASSSDDTTVRVWKVLRDQEDRHAEAGFAVAASSWGQAWNRSEEDSLACLETMLRSSTDWSEPRQLRPFDAPPPSSPTLPCPPTDFGPRQNPNFSGSARGSPPHTGSISPTLRQARLDDWWAPVARGARPREANPSHVRRLWPNHGAASPEGKVKDKGEESQDTGVVRTCRVVEPQMASSPAAQRGALCRGQLSGLPDQAGDDTAHEDEDEEMSGLGLKCVPESGGERETQETRRRRSGSKRPRHECS
jgi:hypothetical protein